MNYMQHLNLYRIARMQNPISCRAICLYYILMEYNNMLGWIREFTIPNSILQGLCGMSRNAIHAARNELKQKGYIEYKNGTGNQCGTYLIVCFDTQTDTQDDTQADTQTQHKTVHNEGPLNKPNQNKTNDVLLQNKLKISYSKIVDDYNRICVSFPKCTRISDKRKSAISARINSGYTEDDFTKLFELAQESDFLKGKNKRNWHADFDWLICDSNMAKTLDGKYVNRENNTSGPESGIDWSGFDD